MQKIKTSSEVDLLDKLFPSLAPHHMIIMSNEEYQKFINENRLSTFIKKPKEQKVYKNE